MAAFDGEDPNGTWTLTISDDLAGDGGTLQSWRLDIATGSCPPSAAPPPPDAPTTPPPAEPAQPPAAPSPSEATSEVLSEAGSLRVGVPRLAVFEAAAPRRQSGKPVSRSRRPTVRCRVTAGPVGSCRIKVRAGGRVLARGNRARSSAGVRVPLELTGTGRRMLAARLGGVRATVSATAGGSTVTARTRAILGTEHVVTPAGSWVPNEAVLTPVGRRFVHNLRAGLVAVQSYSCDGHTAALEAARADSARALALSHRRAQVICGGLPRRGATGKPGLIAHGGTKPIVSNDSKAGRARNRRVEITVHH
jgi:hypothetical protein